MTLIPRRQVIVQNLDYYFPPTISQVPAEGAVSRSDNKIPFSVTFLLSEFNKNYFKKKITCLFFCGGAVWQIVSSKTHNAVHVL